MLTREQMVYGQVVIPSVASITNQGVVSAINPGTTTLTYTKTTDGCDNFMLYTVFANPVAPVIENIIQPTCYLPTGSIELSGLPNTGFWTILRYPNAIPYQGSGTNMIINGLPIESSYTFRLINGDFCTSNTSANAIINGMPVNPVLSGPPSVCTGATTNFLPNSGGTWSSSNTSVATINDAGMVTALAPGTVTFTYVRLSDGCQNSISFTVLPNPDAPLTGEVIQPTCILPTGQIKLRRFAFNRQLDIDNPAWQQSDYWFRIHIYSYRSSTGRNIFFCCKK
jgi:hypothetical protein